MEVCIKRHFHAGRKTSRKSQSCTDGVSVQHWSKCSVKESGWTRQLVPWKKLSIIYKRMTGAKTVTLWVLAALILPSCLWISQDCWQHNFQTTLQVHLSGGWESYLFPSPRSCGIPFLRVLSLSCGPATVLCLYDLKYSVHICIRAATLPGDPRSVWGWQRLIQPKAKSPPIVHPNTGPATGWLVNYALFTTSKNIKIIKENQMDFW